MSTRAIVLGAALLAGLPLWAAGVKVVFDPTSPETGPFPSDFLTVPDAAQKTGLRVSLPLPSCQAEPSTCLEIGLLNQLDGFSLTPRIRVRFSGAINPDTLRDGVFFVWLEPRAGNPYPMEPLGYLTPINQVLYDPKTNTAYAKPDETLEQSRRYALVITDKVRDAGGVSVEPDEAFQSCLEMKIGGDYCEQLSRAIRAHESRLAPARIVGASVFTTLSATAWMEKARAQLPKTPVDVKRSAVFNVGDLDSITVRLQEGANPVRFKDTALPVAGLAGIGRIAFGTYRSPVVLDKTLAIPVTPTGVELPAPAASQDIHFEAFYPAAPAPAGGYPVVIVGHPLPDNRFGLPFAMAATLASKGFASIAINVFGSGLGPEGKVVLKDKSGKLSELPFGGRSLDVDGDGAYTESEGCMTMVGFRDCARQTALDQLQLVRAIQSGLDLDGDGKPDLDGNQINYAGVSIGGLTGAIIHAVEPAIRAAVLNGAPSSVTSCADWAQTIRPLVIGLLALRKPPLLNKGMDYDGECVLRYQPAKVIRGPGAVELQEFLERLEWANIESTPIGFASHLRWSTLPGVPIKRTMFQIAVGDLTVPTPCLTGAVLAANMREMTSVYRHDLARAVAPELAQFDPHYYLIPMGPPSQMMIAMAAQRQVAEFLASDAWVVPDVNPMVRPTFGRDLFETPAVLPEYLGW